MKTEYKYYKNSNTGELIKKQMFKETKTNFPDYYYDMNGSPIKNHPDLLIGFVPISKKKFDKESKKSQ